MFSYTTFAISPVAVGSGLAGLGCRQAGVQGQSDAPTTMHGRRMHNAAAKSAGMPAAAASSLSHAP